MFVDDILIGSESLDVIKHVTSLFSQKFRIKDMGLAEEFLNIRIQQRPGSITIDQEQYVLTVVDKFRNYIGTRNYADVPSMSEYIPRGEPCKSPQQEEFVKIFLIQKWLDRCCICLSQLVQILVMLWGCSPVI